MKITVTQPQVKVDKYPLVMQDVEHTDFLVFFSGAGDGVVLKSPMTSCSVGHHSKTWIMGNFKPFTGIITIDCTE